MVGMCEGSFLLLGKVSWVYSLLANIATGDVELEKLDCDHEAIVAECSSSRGGQAAIFGQLNYVNHVPNQSS